jgi:WD40 repeat protein
MNNNRAYLAITTAAIALVAFVLLYVNSTRLSDEAFDATVDARVAVLLTAQGVDATSQARIEAALTEQGIASTSQARIEAAVTAQGAVATSQAQIAAALTQEGIGATIAAQSPALLTQVAHFYPSETNTPTSTPTDTPTATYTPSATFTPTNTATSTSTPTNTATHTPTNTPTLTPSPDEAAFVITELPASNDISSRSEVMSEDDIWLLSLSPDNDKLAVNYFDTTIGIVDLANGNVEPILEGLPHLANFMSWSPDSERLAAAPYQEDAYDASTMFVWNAETGQVVHRLTATGAIFDAEWSPNGNYLAGVANTLYIWDGHTSQVRAVNPVDGTSIAWAELSYLMYADIRGIWRSELTNLSSQVRLSDREHIVTLRNYSYELTTSPNNTYIAGAIERRIFIARVLGESSTLNLEGHEDIVYGLAWSPNERWLASVSSDRTLRFWDVTTGAEVYQIQYPETTFSVVWLDDDTLILASDNLYVVQLEGLN